MTHIPFITTLPAGISMGGAFGGDTVQMILHAGPVVKFVLLILLLLSVFSWAIIFMKFRLFSKAKRETKEFLDLYWESRDLRKTYMDSKEFNTSPAANLFVAGYDEFSRIRKIQVASETAEGQQPGIPEDAPRSRQAILDNLERSLKRVAIDQGNRLEKALSFLATTGNTSPFIGLFGTVWGIMESFRGIGLKGSANLAVVAPGISEALIATAAGLAAAIPAVVAFNTFNQRLVAIRAEMDIFASDFLGMVGRQLLKRTSAGRGDR